MDGEGGWGISGSMVCIFLFFNQQLIFIDQGKQDCCGFCYLKGYIIIYLNMFSILFLTVLPEVYLHLNIRVIVRQSTEK